MSTLTVLLPDGTQATLLVAANTLIDDGTRFIEPENAKYVLLMEAPTNALTLNFAQVRTSNSYKAQVIDFVPTTDLTTDAALDSAPDPSLGQCLVGITCRGTKIAYILVTNS